MKYYSIIPLFVFIIATSITTAQFSDEKKTSFLDKKESGLINSQPTQSLPLEGVINDSLYIVGPSDGINVSIWISPIYTFNINVSPEGTLLIPTVGEVKVTNENGVGLPLREVKAKVIAAIRKKYIQGEISVTLVTPRPIVVTIAGNVHNPGTYISRSIERVDKIIRQANELNEFQVRTFTERDMEQFEEEQSTRNIVLKRRDGSQIRVDLPKFYAIKNDESNPYLVEGDVILVPRRDKTKNVVAIYGEVNTPGRYEFVEGDSIHDLIEIAHGFTPRAKTDSIEFSRLDNDGKKLTVQYFRAEEILEHNSDIRLHPGDRIVVKSKIELREDYYVEIKGEVRYPGKYPITKDKTYLTEAIRQAGGFTEFAALKSAELIRKPVLPEEIELERLLSQRGNVSIEDSSYYVVETNLRIKKEAVTVDFEKLFNGGDGSSDVILKTEDVIHIPTIRNTIYVFGQVESPGNVDFEKGKDVNYYIQKAGGLTENARGGDVRIVKAKSKQWLEPEETSIEEGDYIWVPKVPERTFAYYATVMSQVASILSVVIGIAVVITNIK